MSSDAVILGMIAGVTVTILSPSPNHERDSISPWFSRQAIGSGFLKSSVSGVGKTPFAIAPSSFARSRRPKGLPGFSFAEIPFSDPKR